MSCNSPTTDRGRSRRRRILGAVLAAGLALAGAGGALDVPFLSGRVNDHAGLLSGEQSARLEQKLKVAEEKTGAQVALLTLDTLDGEPLEDYSHRVASTWQLGRKGKDDGVLLLIAKNDRKMRIEVGYGLEPELTDAESGRILNDLVRPRFRDGDFGGGIEAGIDAILGQIDGSGTLPEAPPASPRPTLPVLLLIGAMFLGTVGIFSVIALFAPGGVAWLLYFFLMPFYAIFPSVASPVLGLLMWGGWTVAFPLLRVLLRHTPWGKGWSSRQAWASSLGTGWVSHSGGSGGSSWPSGGGGFSGGGGSFGGGGASSSW